MVTEKDIFKEGYSILRAAKIEYSEFDAKELFFEVFGHKLTTLGQQSEVTDNSKAEQFLDMCRRRANREPLQYIIGSWEFYSLPFRLSSDVLIPRQDTEILVDAALRYIKKGDTVYDLCTGSGCIGIAVSKNVRCKMSLFDISENALKLAELNARQNGVDVSLYKYDITKDTAPVPADVILSNPPYLDKTEMETLQAELKFEPSLALFGGDDGLDFYRALATVQKGSLKPDGLFIVEIGENQANSVKKIFTDNGYEFLELINDYSGNNRVLIFRNIF